jgi:DNA-binding transcriptional LysR family regulator
LWGRWARHSIHQFHNGSIVPIEILDMRPGLEHRCVTAPGFPTFDQLRVLIAVVESGSFSAAARRLHRAQSVVSYTVANLEAQLGLALFVRGQRRPTLTEAGNVILADARRIERTMNDLRARAAGLNAGLEAELALVVDVMFPTHRLVQALQAFALQFPSVALRLRVEALGAVVELVLDRSCDLGISGPPGLTIEGLERREICDVQLIPVAAPGHPLTRLTPPLPAAVFVEHTQLVLSDRSRLTEGQDYGVFSTHTWRLGDLGAKHALLRAGLGWGRMPEEMVSDDLREGRLLRLRPAEAIAPRFPLILIHRADTRPGPAASWLADWLTAGVATAPDAVIGSAAAVTV